MQSFADFFRSHPFALRFAGLSLGLHLVAAFFSSGFHHYDEQFTILEFTSFKLGLTHLGEMNDHFQVQMRPWFMAWVFWSGAKALKAIGVENPLHWALVFRMLSACLGWVSLLVWYPIAARGLRLERSRKLAWLGLALLWLFPYVHARTSSEGWSGSLFFLGLGVCLSANPWRPTAQATIALLVGLLWGFAFECRFQAGILIAGAVLWCAWVKMPWRAWSAMIFGIVFALAVGVWLDYLGYGVWTASAWNYLRWQLLEGNVNRFGEISVWRFLRFVVTEGGPPFSLLIGATVVTSWIRFPLHPLTWATFPFFLVHASIGHKETRFLFPILTAIPLQVALVYEWLTLSYAPVLLRFRRTLRAIVVVCVVINLVFLLVASTKSTRTEIGVYEFLYPRTGTLYFFDRNPYHLAGVSGGFYRPTTLTIQKLDSPAALSSAPRPFLFFADETRSAFPVPPSCTRAYTSLPPLSDASFVRWIVQRTRMIQWNIYSCR